MNSERGQFWLADGAEQTSSGPAMQQGLLTINEDGGSTIDLDMAEWSWKREAKPFPASMADKFNVVGFLPAQSLYVWLQDAQLRSPPGLSTGGGTRLSSYLTLFYTAPVSGPGMGPSIKKMTIPLGVLWPWLQYPMPRISQTDTKIEILYQLDMKDEFKLSNGSLAVRIRTSISQDIVKRTISPKQQAWLDFEFDRPLSLTESKDFFLHTEDFFVLLTDQECSLEWPEIQLSESEGTGNICVFRRRPQNSEISAHGLWIDYPKIRQKFGEIIESWMDMCPKYGAAFHLYLGIRRGNSVYAEHKFANFMWGLEALHRKAKPISKALSSDQEKKINKICEVTKGILNSNERRKLKRSIRDINERRLSDKLYDLFSELSLGFSDKQLRQFTIKCADRRNAISHYGGPRNDNDYDEFIGEVIHLNMALDQLYHASILKQIGISDDLIRHIFCESLTSARIREQLRLACLILPPPSSLPLPLLKNPA
jgi:hypothetical protein